MTPANAEESTRDATAQLCEQCGQPFTTRKVSGGKPQRFCSPECRTSFHSKNRQGGQRSPTCSAVTEPAATPIAMQSEATQQRSKADVEDFNWYSDDSVVLEKQLRTAVYFNKHDDLVICQEADYPHDEVFICIARRNIMEFIDKLCDVAGIPSFPPKGRP